MRNCLRSESRSLCSVARGKIAPTNDRTINVKQALKGYDDFRAAYVTSCGARRVEVLMHIIIICKYEKDRMKKKAEKKW